MPSGVVPKSVTSTMFGWPMRDAAFASCTKRSTSRRRASTSREHLDRDGARSRRGAPRTPRPCRPRRSCARRSSGRRASRRRAGRTRCSCCAQRARDRVRGVVIAAGQRASRLGRRASRSGRLAADGRRQRRRRCASRQRVGVALRRHELATSTVGLSAPRAPAERLAVERAEPRLAERALASRALILHALLPRVRVQGGSVVGEDARWWRATTRIGSPLNFIVASERPNCWFVSGCAIVERLGRRRVE